MVSEGLKNRRIRLGANEYALSGLLGMGALLGMTLGGFAGMLASNSARGLLGLLPLATVWATQLARKGGFAE